MKFFVIAGLLASIAGVVIAGHADAATSYCALHPDEPTCGRGAPARTDNPYGTDQSTRRSGQDTRLNGDSAASPYDPQPRRTQPYDNRNAWRGDNPYDQPYDNRSGGGRESGGYGDGRDSRGYDNNRYDDGGYYNDNRYDNPYDGRYGRPGDRGYDGRDGRDRWEGDDGRYYRDRRFSQCERTAFSLKRRGYYRIRPVDCGGSNFKFQAMRDGIRYIIKIRNDGRIIYQYPN